MEMKKIKVFLKHVEEPLLLQFSNMLLWSLPSGECSCGQFNESDELMIRKVLERHHEIYVLNYLNKDASSLQNEECYFYQMAKDIDSKYQLYAEYLHNHGLKSYQIPKSYQKIPMILFSEVAEINYEEYQKYLTLLYLTGYCDKTCKFVGFERMDLCILVDMISQELDRRNNKQIQKLKA